MRLSVITPVVLLLLTSFTAAHPDEMKYLPGVKGEINFKQYSGYLDAGDGKYLHYWFVESQRAPMSDPLLLWLNGGPGCSSLQGLLSEFGPFNADRNGRTLRINHYSWNKVANILFLEAPAGVGFSYSDSADYATDDDAVAHDNYRALQHFFTKFPQFLGNDFYITGESYGGIYVPTLSLLVLNGPTKINLKGFAIGNGLLDTVKLGDALIFFAYHHGIIDVTQWNAMTSHCCEGNVSRHSCKFVYSDLPQCMELVQDVLQIVLYSGLNVWNLYADCEVPPPSFQKYSRYAVEKRSLRQAYRFINIIGDTPSCFDASYLSSYINQKSVRSAMHIPLHVHQWELCSPEIEIDYQQIYMRMQPQIMRLLDTGNIRGLIYNGDVDMACNFLGDEWFVEDLGIDVIEDYRPWQFEDQIAGFVKTYKNLDFVTVKGAGHMVPQDKPGPAFKMINSFLFNEPY